MNLEKAKDYINDLETDFNAEFIVSLLYGNDFANNIIAEFDGEIKRNWSKDINFAEKKTYENGDESLAIHLNRAGLYDSLPEALFHQFEENRNASGEDMARQSMKLKAEEREARKFFRPFENEIFSWHVRLSLSEGQLLEKLYSDFLNGLIPDFWSLDREIPKENALRIIKLLPFAHTIAGDWELTRQSLEFILNEKVELELKNDKDCVVDWENIFNREIKKELILGDNTILGSNTEGFIGRVICHIGPVANNDPKLFFNNSPMEHVLNCFFSYFVPMEVDMETNLLLGTEENCFILNNDPEITNSYLGYGTIICQLNNVIQTN